MDKLIDWCDGKKEPRDESWLSMLRQRAMLNNTGHVCRPTSKLSIQSVSLQDCLIPPTRNKHEDVDETTNYKEYSTIQCKNCGSNSTIITNHNDRSHSSTFIMAQQFGADTTGGSGFKWSSALETPKRENSLCNKFNSSTLSQPSDKSKIDEDSSMGISNVSHLSPIPSLNVTNNNEARSPTLKRSLSNSSVVVATSSQSHQRIILIPEIVTVEDNMKCSSNDIRNNSSEKITDSVSPKLKSKRKLPLRDKILARSLFKGSENSSPRFPQSTPQFKTDNTCFQNNTPNISSSLQTKEIIIKSINNTNLSSPSNNINKRQKNDSQNYTDYINKTPISLKKKSTFSTSTPVLLQTKNRKLSQIVVNNINSLYSDTMNNNFITKDEDVIRRIQTKTLLRRQSSFLSSPLNLNSLRKNRSKYLQNSPTLLSNSLEMEHENVSQESEIKSKMAPIPISLENESESQENDVDMVILAEISKPLVEVEGKIPSYKKNGSLISLTSYDDDENKHFSALDILCSPVKTIVKQNHRDTEIELMQLDKDIPPTVKEVTESNTTYNEKGKNEINTKASNTDADVILSNDESKLAKSNTSFKDSCSRNISSVDNSDLTLRTVLGSSHLNNSSLCSTSVSTPKIKKLSDVGIQKLNILMKNAPPTRVFSYPKAYEELHNKQGLKYEHNLNSNENKLSAFIEKDVTAIMKPTNENIPVEIEKYSKNNRRGFLTARKIDIESNSIILKDKSCNAEETTDMSDIIDSFENHNCSNPELENYFMNMDTQDLASLNNIKLIVNAETTNKIENNVRIKRKLTEEEMSPKEPKYVKIDQETKEYPYKNKTVIQNISSETDTKSHFMTSKNVNSAKELHDKDNKMEIESYNKDLNVTNHQFGFSTANEKGMHVSEQALKRAQSLWNDCGTTNIESIEKPESCTLEKFIETSAEESEKLVLLDKTLNFSVARGDIGEKSFQNQNNLECVEQSSEDNTNCSSVVIKVKSLIQGNENKSVGFLTASGKSVNINKSSLLKAKNLWNECGSNSSSDDTQTKFQNNINSNKIENNASNTGFSTGGGKFVSHNTQNHLLKELHSFDKYENNVLSIKQQNVIIPSDVGFSTASGKPFNIKQSALLKAKSMWNDCSSNSSGDNLPTKITSPSIIGFTTADGKSLNINSAALLKANNLLSECGSNSYNDVLSKESKNNHLNDTDRNQLSNNNSSHLECLNLRKETECNRPKDTSVTRLQIDSKLPNIGFSTADGKSINMHQSSLLKANNLWNECGSDSTGNNLNDVDDKMVNAKFSGFSTASGMTIAIDEKALKRSEDMFNNCENDTEKENKYASNDNIKDACEDIIRGGTAGTKFSGCAREGSSVDYADQLENILKGAKSTTTLNGFSTASGSSLKVSKTEMKRAQIMWSSISESDGSNLLLDEESENKPNSNLNEESTNLVTTPKYTDTKSVILSSLKQSSNLSSPVAFKKPIVMPRSNKKGFIKHKIDISKMGGKSSGLPEPATFISKVSKRFYPQNSSSKEGCNEDECPLSLTKPNTNSEMLDKLTAAERVMINEQFQSIAEEFLLDDDWIMDEKDFDTKKDNDTLNVEKDNASMIVNDIDVNVKRTNDKFDVKTSNDELHNRKVNNDFINCKLADETDNKETINDQEEAAMTVSKVEKKNTDILRDAPLKAKETHELSRIADEAQNKMITNSSQDSLQTITSESNDQSIPSNCIPSNHLPVKENKSVPDIHSEKFVKFNTNEKEFKVINSTVSETKENHFANLLKTNERELKMEISTSNFVIPGQKTPTKQFIPNNSNGNSSEKEEISPILTRSRQMKDKIKLLQKHFPTPSTLSRLPTPKTVVSKPFRTPVRSLRNMDS